MRKFIIFLAALFLLFQTKSAKAIYNPLSVSNNSFGIHIIDESDLDSAAKLVNSQNGDWGYVTIVIQKGERDIARWQKVFDQMRRLHIIPIVRLATAPIPGNENAWEKPSLDEIDGWVSFLNSLNWVIKNRYVVIGNEPNHASEWGGEINPEDYAVYLKTISQKLKNENDDFFIMPAGFDASATNTPKKGSGDYTMDESLYLEKMLQKDPEVFKFIDGWVSHSYPNPNFSGPGDGQGKGTVSSFIWELDYLKFLGLQKDLPVFITETGWTHNVNAPSTDIGPKIETAYKNIWNDKRVVAVTPFVLNYMSPPFDKFSWRKPDGSYYDFYQNVISLSKTKGYPIQESNGQFITAILPRISQEETNFHAVLFIKNTGQTIWEINNLTIKDNYLNPLKIESIFPEKVEPFQIGIFLVSGNFPKISGSIPYSLTLFENGKTSSNTFEESVNLIPPFPNLQEVLDYLKTQISLWVRRDSDPRPSP